MKFEKSLVTSMDQLIGGLPYIEVMHLDCDLHISVFKYLGTPSIPQGATSFFGTMIDHRFISDGWRDRFSLMDRNVIPNTYNNHSVWRFSNATMARLMAMKDRGSQGLTEYLELLSRYGRGKNPSSWT